MDFLLGIFDPSSYRTFTFGVPDKEQWPLFVFSKWALVILPLYSVRYFNTAANWFEYGGAGHTIPAFHRLRVFFEKFLAHTMFYIGMGIPIIGLDAILDVYRLIGFTLTNMVIHEVLPLYLSRERFKRIFPEWNQALGVNLVFDNVPLEFSIFLNQRGNIAVRESPHARITNFIKFTKMHKATNDVYLEVVLRRFFVPKDKSPRFFVRKNPACKPSPQNNDLGQSFLVDYGELADYATPIYINQYGWKRWLWRPQYWAKFFNEVGGRSYKSDPFEIIRKFFLVVFGTPLAFIAGNLLVHFQYGQTINLYPLFYFNFGLIFAFTMGGMYGASICSTLTEVFAWKLHQLGKKNQPIFDHVIATRNWKQSANVREYSPYLDPDLFGSALEKLTPAYRRFRFLFAGIVMGGLCSWGLTFYYGQAWGDLIFSKVQTPLINLTVQTGAQGNAPSLPAYPDYEFLTVSPNYHDGANQLYLSLQPQLEEK